MGRKELEKQKKKQRRNQKKKLKSFLFKFRNRNLNFADNIYNYPSVSFIDAILININLWKSAEWLDLALIYLSVGDINKTMYYIQKAINNLKQTKMIVSILNWIGSIGNYDAEEIKGLIQNQINNLNYLILS